MRYRCLKLVPAALLLAVASTVNGLPQSSISITLDGVNIEDNTLKTTDGLAAARDSFGETWGNWSTGQLVSWTTEHPIACGLPLTSWPVDRLISCPASEC
jgi:hypothetical protein